MEGFELNLGFYFQIVPVCFQFWRFIFKFGGFIFKFPELFSKTHFLFSNRPPTTGVRQLFVVFYSVSNFIIELGPLYYRLLN